MTAPEILLACFILNLLLIIIDAALGYFVLPLVLPAPPGELFEEGAGEEGERAGGRAIDGMRRLLSVMVLLYMLVNCYAYYRGHPIVLYIVTGFVILDIIVQLMVRSRRLRQE